MPSNISVGTGFIVRADSISEDLIDVSRQIDIVLYDDSYPVLFREGDFIITTRENVRGTVEVKTSARWQQVESAIQSAVYNAGIVSKTERFDEYFNGVFFYDFDEDLELEGKLSEILRPGLRNPAKIVNHISLGPDFFVKYWNPECYATDRVAGRPHYSVYKLQDLSFAFFISNLIEYVSTVEIEERRPFMYPEDKEMHKLFDIFF